MAEAAGDLDAEVRRVDEDRWLASRFAGLEARRRLVALYALTYEIARTSEVVRDAGVGVIRLAWWRDAILGAIDGRHAASHSAIEAYAASAAASDAPIWRAMIEARAADFESAPFASVSDIEHYADATAGGVLRIALRICGVPAEGAEDVARTAGAAWGLTGLMRAEPYWRARGRRLMASGENCSHAELIRRAREAHAQARDLSSRLPPEAFAAVGYVALVPSYLKRLALGRDPPALFMRQLRLTAASATGRI